MVRFVPNTPDSPAMQGQGRTAAAARSTEHAGRAGGTNNRDEAGGRQPAADKATSKSKLGTQFLARRGRSKKKKKKKKAL